MGFLNNATVTVDAILTKKGRELLAQGTSAFNITKFALADDEVDYRLWDVTHPNGSDYYGTVIENMPLLEAFPDENHVMRYKLVTLPKSTQAMPILEVAQSAVILRRLNSVSIINPSTQNGSDDTLGYTFILHNQSVARLRVRAGAQVSAGGTTVPFFLDEDDLDSNGAQQMVYKYDTRFLDANANQLSGGETEYNTRLGNGESVYIACFVGCTYHCG